jgi:hypothetical protein
MQEYQMSFSHFLKILSYGHGILCRRCKQALCDHELEFYFADVCVAIRAYSVHHYKMCLPHFKNMGGTRQSLLQRELQECQQVASHTPHATCHTPHATCHMPHATLHTPRHQGFAYCHDILVSKMQDFKAFVLNESIIKTLNTVIRKLGKMQSLLSDFLNQQFLRGEVRCSSANLQPPNTSYIAPQFKLNCYFRYSPSQITTTHYGGKQALQILLARCAVRPNTKISIPVLETFTHHRFV